MKNNTRIVGLMIAMQVIAFAIQAQSWGTVGNGLPVMSPIFQSNFAATTFNQELYVSSASSSSTNRFVRVSKWNGTSWQHTTPYYPPGTAFQNTLDIEILNGDIYLAIAQTPGIGLLKFDGSTWTPLSPPGFSGFIWKMYKFNNELYLTGSFTASGGIQSIMKYDGNQFIGLPPLPLPNLNSINDIIHFNNSIYVSTLSNFPYNPDSLLFKLDNNIWESLTNFSQATGSAFIFTEYQNELLGFSLDKIYKIKNDSIIPFDTISHSVNLAAIHNGEIYLSDGFSNTLTSYDGVNVVQFQNVPVAIKDISSFQNQLFLFSTQQVFNGINYNHAYRSDLQGGLVDVQFFNDLNLNCQRDSSENALLKGLAFKIGNNFIHSNTGRNVVFLQVGAWQIDSSWFYQPQTKNLSTCTLPINFTINNNQTTQVNIPIQNNIPIDLGVKLFDLWGWQARWGFKEPYKAVVTNHGNTMVTNTGVTVAIPTTLTIDSVVPTPSSQLGNVFTFIIDTILPYQQLSYFFYTEVDTATNNLGDSLKPIATIFPLTTDADLSDNADTLRQIIIGAYDPNDKTPSATLIAPGTNKIDYHIRFQNTGTDTAFRVIVVDSLNMGMPITSVIINGSSHPFNFSVVGNVLIWEFDNIMLPDSSADFMGSMGYVNFTTTLNPNLALGDTVKNQANIYFDFQPPIHTNVAKTAVVNNISIHEHTLPERTLFVYPNPARDYLIVSNKSMYQERISLLSADGRTMLEMDVSPFDENQMSIAHLPAGIYYLRSGHITYKIIIQY